MLANAHTQHQWTTLTRQHNGIGGLAVNDGEGVGALQHGEHLSHRGQQSLLCEQRPANQLGYHLGVRVGDTCHTILTQRLTQRTVVFDNAVMHHRHSLVDDMWVCIQYRWFTMCRPTGVGDASAPLYGLSGLCIFQCRHAAQAFMAGQTAAPVDQGETGGVIAAIFEPA